MSNTAVWSVRRRHEWLSAPLKKKRVKRRQAKRIGLWDAWERKKKTPAADASAQPTDEAPAS
jgi:hypothetical protein